MIYRFSLLILLILAITTNSAAQYFNTGTDPAGIKWLQIKTDRFTLIYPESYGNQGITFAKSLDNSLDKLKALYPGIKTNMPVVVHNYTTFSNGYVAWAPRRIELFPTPEQNTIPLDPVEQLTVHEMTHVMQMYSLRKGFSKAMTLLGGEQVTGASAIFLPMWFMEGDAVFSESALTPSGRGRTPAFQKQLKAIVIERKKIYRYDKMLFGSFRDYTPDQYQYGYQISAWSHSKFGHDIWNKALDFTAKYPFTGSPMQFSLMKSTGLTKERLFSRTFDTLKIIWEKDILAAKTDRYDPININKRKDFINYYSPVAVGKDSIVAIRTSLYDPPSFVLLNPAQNKEKRIHTPGQMYPWFLSYAAGKIVWVEIRPDIRWENRTYSDVLIMDLRKGFPKMLSHRSRYLAASLSPDGRFVAAVENTIDNVNRIVVIDAFNGSVLNTINTPGNAYPQRPQWSEAGDKITVISLTKEGEGILSWSVKTGLWQTLIEPSRNDLQASFLRKDTLYYVSSESGTDNIYMLIPGGKTMMITNSKYGAYDPFISGGNIYFSDYTSSGYRVCKISQDILSYKDTDFKMKDSFLINSFDTLNKPDKEAAGKEYTPEPYKKVLHLFRLHSWMPFYTDMDQIQTDPTTVSPGITLLTQNVLSTLISSLGYEYKDGRHNFHYRLRWQGWLPVFESRLDYGASPGVYNLGNSVGEPSQLSTGLSFTNSLSLPLTFSTGRFTQMVWGSLSASYQNNYIYMKESGAYDYGQTQIMSRIYFANYSIPADNDIYPRWAQMIDYTWITYPADRDIYGPMSSFKTAAYIPGIFRSQSIRLRFETDYQQRKLLLLYNLASLPRGYHNMVSLNYRLYSVDYAMPLLYPDLSIPSLLYLKRIRAGLFFDYARGKGNLYLDRTTDIFHDYRETFSSFGTELLADFYLLRIPVLISGGVQAAWKSISEKPSIEGILKVDIFGMKIGRRRI